jgi:hypothetical protein
MKHTNSPLANWPYLDRPNLVRFWVRNHMRLGPRVTFVMVGWVTRY